MKKKNALLWVLAGLAVLLLASCGAHQKEPPALTVTCGDREITAWRGSYHWERWGQSVIADSPHPLDVLEDLPVLEAQAGEEVELDFPSEPGELAVLAYPDDCVGAASQAESVNVPLEGNVLVIPGEGTGMVYEVRTSWSQGSAVYAFYVPEAGGEGRG